MALMKIYRDAWAKRVMQETQNYDGSHDVLPRGP